MTWEQKFAAMKALCGDVVLEMRYPGSWYVSARVREIKHGSLLSGTSGNGSTPEEAVNDDWRKCVEELPPGQQIVLDAYGPNQRYASWNGFMWDVKTEKDQPCQQ